MNWSSNSKVLVLAPHTDDAEFGCGGTLNRMINSGLEVYQVAFSSAANINEHGTRNKELEKELMIASGIIGLNPDNVFIHDFEVRKFADNRQKILDLMLYYKKTLKPDIIFTPCKHDIHQDHSTIYKESLRAFKHQTIFGYECPWNLLEFNYDIFVKLSAENISKKIEACISYESQSGRPYSNPKVLNALAISRGLQCQNEYAESFECIRINL